MPTYAYACTACEHKFDAVQSFTDDALTDCPQCSGRLRKLFAAVGIVFKGSGFYRTDSRNGGKQKSENGAGKSADSGDSSDKSDSGTSKESSSPTTPAGKSSDATSNSSSSNSSSSTTSTSSPAKAAP